MNGILPETRDEFCEALAAAQPPNTDVRVIRGTVNCIFLILGAMKDDEILKTIRRVNN